MQLSVVILNYNVRYFLEQCILSVQEALEGIDSEIIVVDNASKDDSCEMVKKLFPNVILIENKENTGFPKGNNIGVAQAKGRYLCILNPDTVVSEDTFTKILKFAENVTNLGIIGCKLIDGTGAFLPESKRNIPTPKISLLKMLGQSKHYYANHLSEDEIGKASVFVGAFMFVERQKYIDLKGFDEDFFMYGEDIDLSYRFLKQGFDNYYFGQTTVLHYKGESTNKDKVYLNRFYGAMKIFYKKHFKTNFLFDLITDIGIKIFSVLNSLNKKKSLSINYTNCFLVSDSVELKKSIQNLLSKEIILIKEVSDLNHIKLTNRDTNLIVFDENFLPYKDILSKMQKYNHPTTYFKIKPKGSDFLIGSNSKNDKGEVLIIE